jgi:glycosyltransferase involved in cell wall biosynthesis
LAIGRLVPMKGFDIAINAIARANKTAGWKGAELTIIGDGPERTNLESLVKSLGAASEINFTGALDNAEVLVHLRNAGALIVPSLFEPYGVVVLEALAQGRPVLASNRVVAALDRDDASGAVRIHPVGDADELARQITLLAADREALRNASQAAREIAELWRPERAGTIIDTVIETISSKRLRVSRSDNVAYHAKNETPSAITKWN